MENFNYFILRVAICLALMGLSSCQKEIALGDSAEQASNTDKSVTHYSAKDYSEIRAKVLLLTESAYRLEKTGGDIQSCETFVSFAFTHKTDYLTVSKS